MLGAHKKHPQARQRMYILYILWLRVRNANSILRGTTAIRGGSNTLRIFNSGTDAAGYIRSDGDVSKVLFYYRLYSPCFTELTIFFVF